MRDRLITSRISKQKTNCLLLGPRQVGKSTLARSLSPRVYINLADEEQFLHHAKDTGLLRRELCALREAPGALIVIDEIQRIPSLLNTVQSLIDEDKSRFRFILTGSSARKLRRGGANLLPGRVVTEQMCPLLISELNEEIDIERAVSRGMLPGIYLDVETGDDILGSYANTYLREEVQKEGLVENIGGFSRLLDAVALASGSWLNYSKLSSDTEIPKETVRRYISILEDTLVLERLQPFRPRLKQSRRVSQKEKILLFDIGVRNALLGVHNQRVTPEQKGNMFEQWLVLQIIGLKKSLRKEWEISSFLTTTQHEVDLVIETPEAVVGIEMKSGSALHLKRHAGLLALQNLLKRYKPVKKWILYTGKMAQELDDDTLVLPWLEGLRQLQEMN